MAQLRAEAPDLADLTGMSLDEAVAKMETLGAIEPVEIFNAFPARVRATVGRTAGTGG